MAPITPTTLKNFKDLENLAANCSLCPAMANQPAIFSKANGNLNANIVFVAEAPGRFGAGRTGIPFHGDKSGENFEKLLKHIGFTLKDDFIKNADKKEIKLCNDAGRPTRPLLKVKDKQILIQKADIENIKAPKGLNKEVIKFISNIKNCLLYTSDAAEE